MAIWPAFEAEPLTLTVTVAVVPETRCHTPFGPCGDGSTNVIEVSLRLVMLRVAPSKGAPQLVPRSARKR
jgi:hypothetical protein